MKSPTEQYRYQRLVELLQCQADTKAEAQRIDYLIGVLVAALPAERVGQAYRLSYRLSA